jgi:hypothetical protein
MMKTISCIRKSRSPLSDTENNESNHRQSLTIFDNHWQSWLSKNLFSVQPSEQMIVVRFSVDNQMYFQKILELAMG